MIYIEWEKRGNSLCQFGDDMVFEGSFLPSFLPAVILFGVIGERTAEKKRGRKIETLSRASATEQIDEK